MTLHLPPDTPKLVVLVLSLGFDTLAVAIGLGLSGLDRRDRVRFGIACALGEGSMAIVGFLAGNLVAGVIGDIASGAAIVLLLAVGLYIVREAFQGDDHSYAAPTLITLFTTALSVSLDELAVGFTLGLLHIPVLLAASMIAGQAFLLTLIGTAIGRLVGKVLAERAELLSGVVLVLLAFFLLGEKLVGT